MQDRYEFSSSSVTEKEWDDEMDFSAPLYELLPPEVMEQCRDKVVDEVSWATKPAFNGGKAIFRDATPLALAFAWLEPYRARTNIAIIRFTDGTMLRIRRGHFLEIGKDRFLNEYQGGGTMGKPRHPFSSDQSTPVEFMVRPFDKTAWILERKILAGPDLGPGLSDYHEKQRLLAYYGVTRVLSLFEEPSDNKKEIDRLDESLSVLRKTTRSLGWELQYACEHMATTEMVSDPNSAGRLLDAVFNARSDYGLLYVAANEAILAFLEVLFGKHYGLPVHHHATGYESNPNMAPTNLTLYDAMRKPPKGYPARME